MEGAVTVDGRETTDCPEGDWTLGSAVYDKERIVDGESGRTDE